MEDIVMKKVACTLAFMLLVLSVEAGDITKIVNIFKEGKASGSAVIMDEEVDIAIPGTTKKGTGKETEGILTLFFESFKPADFTVLHHADKNETGFVVGKLTTGNKEFRINITYCVKGDAVLIQSIRIE